MFSRKIWEMIIAYTIKRRTIISEMLWLSILSVQGLKIHLKRQKFEIIYENTQRQNNANI